MQQWDVTLRGGAYDGYQGIAVRTSPPTEIVVAWSCGPGTGCRGHATFDPHDEGIVLRTAESYRRVELDAEKLTAVYEVGDGSPGGDGEVVEERELPVSVVSA